MASGKGLGEDQYNMGKGIYIYIYIYMLLPCSQMNALPLPLLRHVLVAILRQVLDLVIIRGTFRQGYIQAQILYHSRKYS